MKTAISIPNTVFAVADRLAHRLGMSRSQLYVTALRSFLEKHQTAHITEKLNAVYSKETSVLDSQLQKLQARSIASKDAW